MFKKHLLLVVPNNYIIVKNPSLFENLAIVDRNWLHLENLKQKIFIISFATDCVKIVEIMSPNEGKYGPEKLRIWTFFTQWLFQNFLPGTNMYGKTLYYIFLECLKISTVQLSR